LKISRRQMLAAIALPAAAAKSREPLLRELPDPLLEVPTCPVRLTVFETRSNPSFTRMTIYCPTAQTVQGIIVNGTRLPDDAWWDQVSVGPWGQELTVLVPTPLWFNPLYSEVIAEFEPRKQPPRVLHEGIDIERNGTVVTYTAWGVAFQRGLVDR
jgi:hypothetical protein